MAAALAGCQIGPATGPDPEVEAAPYPALSTVPPRPRLTYSIDQRREIADALVSDRANARYDREVVRYELGLDDTAPPAHAPTVIPEPEPPEGGVEAKPTPPVEPLPPGGGVIADLAVRQQVLTQRNNGQIESFLNIMQKQIELNRQAEAAGIGVLPDTVQPLNVPGELPKLGQPHPAPPADGARHPALDFFSNLFGLSDDGPAPTPPAADAAGPHAATDAAAGHAAGDAAAVEPQAGPPPAAAEAAAPTPAPSPPPAEATTPAAAAAAPAASPPAAAAVEAALPALGDAVTVTFAPHSVEVPPGAEPTLRAAAETARTDNRRLHVEGHGASPALGLDRARAVASWLMRLGAPPDMVTLKGAGAGDQVIVRLAPAGAA